MLTFTDLLKNFFTHKDFLPYADKIPGTMFTPLHFVFAAVVLTAICVLIVYFLYLLIHALPYLPLYFINRKKA